MIKYHYPLVICYIAIEHGPFIDDLPLCKRLPKGIITTHHLSGDIGDVGHHFLSLHHSVVIVVMTKTSYITIGGP